MQSISLYRVETVPVPITTSHTDAHPEWRWGAEGEGAEGEGAGTAEGEGAGTAEGEGAGTAEGEGAGTAEGVQRVRRVWCRWGRVQGCRGVGV